MQLKISTDQILATREMILNEITKKIFSLLLLLLSYNNTNISGMIIRKSSLPIIKYDRFYQKEIDNILMSQNYSIVLNKLMNKNSTIATNILQMQSEALKNTYQEIKTDWITQRIDNFNPNDKREFEQRYMSNLEFYNNSGLAFLKIGGEKEISKSRIGNTMNPFQIWAKKYGAACFYLEHRFFGASQPFEDHSMESYKYLTVNQALADIKNFIVQMNEMFFLDIEKPRWILFGGSYGGALAAWFREMNEELTIAAIVSSAVVQAEVDYYDYTKNLEYVLKEENAPCAETIRLSIKALIEKTYTVDGRAELGKVFNMCEPFTEPPIAKDIQFFLANILYTFGGYIQYAGGCRLPDVSYFCDLITD
ncbi:unnamed protein product, partial [Wuchereria bancrofti]